MAINLKLIIWAIAIIGLFFVFIKYREKIKQFLLEVRVELGKVAWSSPRELMGTTVVVITTTALMALFIGLVDILLSKILSVVFK